MHRSQSATTSRLGRRRSRLGDTSRAKTGISSTPISFPTSSSMKVDDMNSQGTPPTEESSTHSDDDMPHFSRPAQSSLNVQKRNLQRRLSRRNSADAPGLDNKSPQGKERTDTDTDTERPARPARIALNAQKQAMERRMARRNSIGADIPSQISKYSASRISQRGSEVEEGKMSLLSTAICWYQRFRLSTTQTHRHWIQSRRKKDDLPSLVCIPSNWN